MFGGINTGADGKRCFARFTIGQSDALLPDGFYKKNTGSFMPAIQNTQKPRLQLSAKIFKKGDYLLVEENKQSDFFFIIQSGQVYVTHANEVSSEKSLNMMGPGDFIGVISCMSNKTQIETAIAMTDVSAILVRKSQYPDLIQLNTPVALKIIRGFSKRMKALNEILMQQTTNKKARDNQAEMIYSLAKHYDNDDQTDVALFAYYQYLKLNIPGPGLEDAKHRFLAIKKSGTKAVYLEPTNEVERTYPRGTMIFSDFQPGSEMFIIKEGSVKISKVTNDTEVTLAILKQGDMFGEMALLNNDLRSASAIANETCKLTAVSMSNFIKITETNPAMITKITTTFSDRLWAMQRQLSNSLIRDDLVQKMLDMLSLQIEKLNFTEEQLAQPYQTNFTTNDIATMCGLTKLEQARNSKRFINQNFFKIVNNKILIKKCSTLIDYAATYRKNLLKRQH